MYLDLVLIISTIVSTCILALGGLAFLKAKQLIQEYTLKNKAVEIALTDLLRIRITESKEHYIKRKWAYDSEKQLIQELHQVYKNLGGNGHVDTIVKDIMNMPASEAEYNSRFIR
ncbi:hypothetical protein LJC10_00425 [Selenomonadales bacterium OttesenSCG-928-I06]|nr:hypothetical protein [Selenomonadales bacterium OttesenSCG-928-I06]